jgi:hypothetical protein
VADGDFDEAALVNQIYDEYRVMLLNKKYYAARLTKTKRYNFVMEFLIAVGATGSGVAGLAVWKTDYGAGVWAGLSTASILLAIAKPLLKLTDRIENYGKLYGEYARAFQNLEMLVRDLQVYKLLSDDRIKTFIQIRSRTAELVALDDTDPNPQLVAALQAQVNAEIDVSRLWLPVPAGG